MPAKREQKWKTKFAPAAEPRIRVLLVDDHRLMLDCWTLLLQQEPGIDVVGCCRDARTVPAQVIYLKPDVIVTDIEMEPVDGFELVRRILASVPGARLIGISMFSNLALAKRLMKMGGMGFVTKNSPAEELTMAIRQVHGGAKYTCRELRDQLSRVTLEGTEAAPGITDLTQRELEVIHHTCKGMRARETAEVLGMTCKTVEVHLYNIMRKLGVRNRAELVSFALRNGL